MFNFVKKLSIGQKISLLALTMFGLLITAMSISVVKINLVKEELTDLAHINAPLSRYISLIEINTLEKEIHAERLEKYLELYRGSTVGQHDIEKEFQFLKDKNTTIIKLIDLANSLLKEEQEIIEQHKGKGKATAVAEYARIELFLDMIEEENQELNDKILVVVKYLKNYEDTKAHLIELWIERSEETLNKHLMTAANEMLAFTHESILEAEAHESELIIINLVILVLSICIGLGLALYISRGIVKPLSHLLESVGMVERGNLDVSVKIRNQDEVGKISDSFNAMVLYFKQQERAKSIFGQYVDPRVIKSVVSTLEDEDLSKAKLAPTSMFFSDIAGFSKISEQLTPTALVNLINEYITMVTDSIVKNQGVIDKFIGDAVTAFWTIPFCDEKSQAIQCCLSALAQQEKLTVFRKMIPEITGIRKGFPEINVRMGIASDEMLVGDAGPDKIKSFTVIGIASRWAEDLEALNKTYGTKILISENTYKLAHKECETRLIDFIPKINATNNKQTTYERIYELVGYKHTLTEEQKELNTHYSQAVVDFYSKKPQEAQLLLKKCLAIQPADMPSKRLQQIIDESK